MQLKLLTMTGLAALLCAGGAAKAQQDWEDDDSDRKDRAERAAGQERADERSQRNWRADAGDSDDEGLDRQSIAALLDKLETSIEASVKDGDKRDLQQFVRDYIPQGGQIWIRNEVMVDGDSAMTNVATLSREQLLALGRFGGDMGGHSPENFTADVSLRDYRLMNNGKGALVQTTITESASLDGSSRSGSGRSSGAATMTATFECQHVIYTDGEKPQIGVTSCEGVSEL